MYQIKIPFSGFYHTNHELNIEYAHEQECTEDDGRVDPNQHTALLDSTNWQAVRTEYAKKYVQELEGELPNMQLQFVELRSPREYNFQTDSIVVQIHEDDLQRLLNVTVMKHNVALAEHIKKELEPRSGFIPSYPNSLDDWLEDCGCELLSLDDAQVDLIFEVFVTEATEFNESTVADDWSGNGYLSDWIHANQKQPEPEPEPRYMTVKYETHVDAALSPEHAAKVASEHFKNHIFKDDQELEVSDEGKFHY